MHQHHDPEGIGDLDVERMKSFAAAFRAGFPDLHDTIDLQLAEDDLVATRFTSGAPTWACYRTTCRKLRWTGIVIDRVADGKIAESWGNWDMMGMLQQLGAVAVHGPRREPAFPNGGNAT